MTLTVVNTKHENIHNYYPGYKLLQSKCSGQKNADIGGLDH